MSSPKRIGSIIVVTGPSGVGKNTVVEQVLDNVDGIAHSISITTRDKRPGEQEGKDYFFRTRAEFEKLIAQNEFLEWAEFAGCLYGTPKAWVKEQIENGLDVILEIEVQGAMQIAKQCPESVLVFLSPPSFDALKERLNGRATETPEKIAVRLEKAKNELTQRHLFNFEIINDNLEVAVSNLIHIIHAERCRILKAQ